MIIVGEGGALANEERGLGLGWEGLGFNDIGLRILWALDVLC